MNPLCVFCPKRTRLPTQIETLKIENKNTMKTTTLATLTAARKSYPAETATFNPYRANAAALLVMQLDNGAEMSPANIAAICSQTMRNPNPGPRVIARIIDIALSGKAGDYLPSVKHPELNPDNISKLPIALGKIAKAKRATRPKK